MASVSARMSLVKPSKTDQFSTADIAANWQKIDDSPGTYVCTSTSRPLWNTNQRGRMIWETDTKLLWAWSGSAWDRVYPTGMLRNSSNSPAYKVFSSTFSTQSGSFVSVFSISNVVVPAGGRPIEVTVNYPRIQNEAGMCEGALIRSTANNGTPLIERWQITGDSTSPASGAQGEGGSRTSIETGLAAGTYSWSFQIRSWSNGKTTSMDATSGRSAALWIKEL